MRRTGEGGKLMGNRIDQQQTVTLEELAISNSYEIAALVNVLVRKGILTREEVLQELRLLRQQVANGESAV